jgi:hypothetical protein
MFLPFGSRVDVVKNQKKGTKTHKKSSKIPARTPFFEQIFIVRPRVFPDTRFKLGLKVVKCFKKW